MKSKIEKDKGKILNEIADARAATDEVMRAQSSADKSNKKLSTSLNDVSKKINEANLTLGDFEASKRKIAAENADLIRVVGDYETNFNMIMKVKGSLAGQLSEVKANADNEARERSLLLGKFRNLEHELDGAKEALDEESSSRDNCLRQVAKAEGDANMWRAKYESEAVAKAEEVEKTKGKLHAELETVLSNLDAAQVMNAAMERKAKQFDKVIGEWKAKVDSLSHDLDMSQKETRNASSELFKVKSAYEETVLQLDEVRRENKTLSNEIKDIMDQISEGG